MKALLPDAENSDVADVDIDAVGKAEAEKIEETDAE